MHVQSTSALLTRQRLLTGTRHANVSSKHLFPFPPGTNPTPHDIFHLPRCASQSEIKSRYYELVKLYHPDATRDQLDVSPLVRNARFRAITHAYGILRGRNDSTLNAPGWNYYESRDEVIRAELRRRSRRSRSSSTTSTASSVRSAHPDDSQLWYSLIVFVFAGMIAALSSASSHMDRVERHSQSAAANLAQARTDAQIYGIERRRKIRERVREFHGPREIVDGTKNSDMHHTSKGDAGARSTWRDSHNSESVR